MKGAFWYLIVELAGIAAFAIAPPDMAWFLLIALAIILWPAISMVRQKLRF